MGILTWWRLRQIAKVARAKYDGHFTVLHFTTNVRVGFGTPFDLYGESGKVVPAFKTLAEACKYALKYEPCFYETR